jgi:integrase
LQDYSRKIELSTIPGYQNTLNHIIKAFCHRRVSSMRAIDIENFLEQMAGIYSISRCGKMRTMLGQILRKAEANMLVDKNLVPLADRMNYRRMGKKSGKKDAFTAAEVVALMNKLPETRIGHSIRLMLGTGISSQELLGLSSFDITQDGSPISIRRAVKIKEGGSMYIGEVKAENRERDIDVPPSVQPSIKYLRDNANGYIIAGKNENMPMHPSTYRKFYKSAVSQVDGVRVLTPHCCRHTYISHLEDAHTDFAVIQALSGQSTQSATISYMHLQSPSIAAAVGTIEVLLTGGKSAVGTQLVHIEKSEK